MLCVCVCVCTRYVQSFVSVDTLVGSRYVPEREPTWSSQPVSLLSLQGPLQTDVAESGDLRGCTQPHQPFAKQSWRGRERGAPLPARHRRHLRCRGFRPPPLGPDSALLNSRLQRRNIQTSKTWNPRTLPPDPQSPAFRQLPDPWTASQTSPSPSVFFRLFHRCSSPLPQQPAAATVARHEDSHQGTGWRRRRRVRRG